MDKFLRMSSSTFLDTFFLKKWSIFWNFLKKVLLLLGIFFLFFNFSGGFFGFMLN